jgi:hypothetical protein
MKGFPDVKVEHVNQGSARLGGSLDLNVKIGAKTETLTLNHE